MNWSVQERRNCRRVVFAVSLLALAALGNAARAQAGVDEEAGIAGWPALAASVQFVGNPGADLPLREVWVVGLRFELAHEKSWLLFAQRSAPRDSSVARTDE